MDSADDIMLWPDGTWCYRYDLNEYSWMSDDYEVLPCGSRRYRELDRNHEAVNKPREPK